MELLETRHAMFLYRSLKFLPTPYQTEDSNRMTIAYFCLSGLSLLPSSAISSNSENQSALDVLIKDNQREGFKDWIYNLQDIGGGFRGGNSMDFEERLPQNSIPNLVPLSLTEEEEFELLMSFEEPDSPILSTKLIPPSSLAPANLIQTYTALLCLGILSCSLERLNIAALIRFVAKCQNDDGSFSMFPGCAEPADPRSTYSAFTICSILDDWSGVDIERGLYFLASCQRPDGGFASRPGLESQGGTTYCSVASYSLASKISSTPNPKQLLHWLVNRQTRPVPNLEKSDSESDSDEEELISKINLEEVAGFQGRPSKSPDACYSFWCSASLRLLSSYEFLDPILDRNWLLSCQHQQYGGIAREPGALPDVYHTYLSLAALSLGKYPSLPILDAGWNVSSNVKDFLQARILKLRNAS